MANPIEWWTNKQIILIIIFGIVSITTTLGNLLVLYIFTIAKSKLRSPTHLLLASLAFADFLIGIIIMPTLASVTISNFKWFLGETLCKAWDSHFCLCAASMFSMIGICIERYIGVKYPLEHRRIMSRKRVIRIIVFIWILAFIITAIPLTMWPIPPSGIPRVCNCNLRQDFTLFIALSMYWIPITVTVIIYWLIYKNAVKPFELGHLKQRVDEMADGYSKSDDKKYAQAKLKQTRLAKKIAWVVGVMIIFYGPLFFVLMLNAINSPWYSIDYLLVAGWLRYFNSCVNTFLYALAVPGYKQEVRRIICRYKKRKTGFSDMTTSEVTSYAPKEKDVEFHEQEILKDAGDNLNSPNIDSKGLNDRYCNFCGNLMNNAAIHKLDRCNKCLQPRQCGSWILPTEWGKPSYFSCPNCNSMRYFDGVQGCFCHLCNHRFSPPGSAPEEHKIAHLLKKGKSIENSDALSLDVQKCLSDIARITNRQSNENKGYQEVNKTKNLPQLSLNSEVMEELLRSDSFQAKDKADFVRKLRSSVIDPIMERRSVLLTTFNDSAKDVDWESIRELDEILEKLQSTVILPLTTNYSDLNEI